MASKTKKSIEEKVEDLFKKQLDKYNVKYFTKTESMNPDIDKALCDAPSKSGGDGNNYPDIRVLVETKELRRIPVMIEVKGKDGDLIYLDKNNNITLTTIYATDTKTHKAGDVNYSAIQKYAVNGAIHYAKAIIEYGNNYDEVIAIGLNGYEDADGSIKTEIGAYYISRKNMCVPKKIKDYTNLSFLKQNNIDKLIAIIDTLSLTEREKADKARETEEELDKKLRTLNQIMQDTLSINVSYRVNLIAGMIMAGLGVEDKVPPLEISELKGSKGKKDHDGCVIINKIESFLDEKNLPVEKQELIIETLSASFIHGRLWVPVNGESKLKSIYTIIKNEIMSIFRTSYHLDFTGKLFNVLNEWVNVPDGDKNDVVLTPRYVTELMVKLAKVNMKSYVWDYATGSAGFLVSAMNIMLKDAEKRIDNPDELSEIQSKIKDEQLLGIEKLPDIYMLAVLNMILMGDGSSNIIHKDSLTQFEGEYEQGRLKGIKFPADVFLLNPPYSANGKGFIFVEKALSRMEKGRAVILIQENAGSGFGLPYTKNILKNNTLIASIHMPDIFRGKVTVQTAIYVFDVGIPHDEKQVVKFIDFSNDGYTRLSKKKSAQDVNLKNTNNAMERYDELVNLVLYGKKYLNYFTEKEYIEDTISLKGNDWVFNQHKKVDVVPKEEDFVNTLKDFLCWKVSAILKGEIELHLKVAEINNNQLSESEKNAIDRASSNDVLYRKFKIGMLFDIHPTKSYNCTNPTLYDSCGKNPVVSNSSEYNGRTGFSAFETTEKDIMTFSDTTSGMSTLFYQEGGFIGYSHVQGLFPYSDKWNRDSCLYLISVLKKHDNGFDYATKMTRDIVSDFKVLLPIIKSSAKKKILTVNDIDFDFMENYICALKKNILKKLIE